MAKTVQDDLRHRAFADRIVARFVQHRRRKAVGRAVQAGVIAGEPKRASGGIGRGRKRDRVVERPGILGRQVDERDRLDRRYFGLGNDPFRRNDKFGGMRYLWRMRHHQNG